MRAPFSTDPHTPAADTARPRFRWKGVDGSGSPRQGEIRARNAAHAEALLRHQGIQGTRVSRDIGFLNQQRSPHLGRAIAARFLRQLGSLLQAGIPILQALERVEEGFIRLEERALVKRVHDQVEAGQSLSQACSLFPKAFPTLVLELLRAGETSGRLDQVLLRAAHHLEDQLALQRKLRNAALYPSIVFVVAMAVSGLLLTYVVPQFAELFQSQGLQLPALTASVVAASVFLQDLGGWLVILLLILGFVSWRTRDRWLPKLRPTLDPLWLRLPLLGSIVRTAQLARFARTLETLLQAGVPILTALQRSGQVLTSQPYQLAVAQLRTRVEQGQALAHSLRQSSLFPPLVVQFVKTGEESGQLTTLLARLADTYEAELRQQLDRFTTLAEPILILLISAVVGILVIAMYLPIFQMGQAF
ncbi:MAG: type II secretion system F family protein [Gammaproteobacteria bacterium]